MQYFTAHTHFSHRGIIEHCDRPFKNIDAMNTYLIDRWNEVVGKGDTVYHLRDFAWGISKGFGTLGVEEIIDSLNGQIFLVHGSHDKPALKLAHKFVKVAPLLEISINGQLMVLCHYSMRTWRKSHFNSWHLFGHSHGRLEGFGKSFDCGVDTKHLPTHTRYSPYSFPEIAEIMKSCPDNFNLVKKEA